MRMRVVTGGRVYWFWAHVSDSAREGIWLVGRSQSSAFASLIHFTTLSRNC